MRQNKNQTQNIKIRQQKLINTKPSHVFFTGTQNRELQKITLLTFSQFTSILILSIAYIIFPRSPRGRGHSGAEFQSALSVPVWLSFGPQGVIVHGFINPTKRS